MSRNDIIRSLIGFVLPFVILVSLTFSQDDKKRTDEQKKQDKLAKAEESASKKQAKQERRYQRIVVFAREKADIDPGVRLQNQGSGKGKGRREALRREDAPTHKGRTATGDRLPRQDLIKVGPRSLSSVSRLKTNGKTSISYLFAITPD